VVVAAGPIRILIVDDHPLLREGIAALVGGPTDMTLVAEAPDAGVRSDSFRAGSLELVSQKKIDRSRMKAPIQSSTIGMKGLAFNASCDSSVAMAPPK